MNFFLRALPKPRAIRATRTYTTTPFRLYPTALHRAERAADLKAHPESALTQEKVPDRKHNHHWSEENATESEADIKADHDPVDPKTMEKNQQKKSEQGKSS